MSTIISIITDWGQNYGSGHIQRMASLCMALNEVHGVTATIVNTKKPDIFIGRPACGVVNQPDPGSALIIRDKRDSSAEDITHLKKTAPVLVIDDIGPGRAVADHIMDLLPNPQNSTADTYLHCGCFLYGYNFIESLRTTQTDTLGKTIDFTFYAGAEIDNNNIAFFHSLVPDGANAIILCEGMRLTLNIPPKLSIENMNYAEILLRTKVFVAHFGISLYEAHLCGCKVLSINPTPYHSRLADLVLGDVVDINAGTKVEQNMPRLEHLCLQLLKECPFSEVSAAMALDVALKNLYACRADVLSLA